MFTALLFNCPLGQRLLHWEGIDPLWSLIPIGLLFLYSLAQAIYQQYAVMEGERNGLLVELGRQTPVAKPIRVQPAVWIAAASATAAVVLLLIGLWIGRSYFQEPPTVWTLHIVGSEQDKAAEAPKKRGE